MEPAETAYSLIVLVIVLAAAKIGGELVERLRQPAVLGELLAGVLLGLTALGGAASNPAIAFIATIGVILLLFEVGLEGDLDELRRVGASAGLVAAIGVVLPFAVGYAVTLLILGDSRQALFLGATLTATSVGITARVISDMGRMSSAEAKIILGAAVIDDILGLLVLSVVLTIAASGAVDVLVLIRDLGIALGFLVGAVWIGIRFANPLINFAQRLRTRGVLVSVAFIFCLTMAFAAEELGLAEIVGAFAAGLVLASTEDRVKIQQRVKPLADVFVPVFFVVVGMRVDLAALSPTGPGRWTLVILGATLFVLAVVTKLAAGLGVLGKHANKLAVGVGMVPRGEVGLIFASVGLSAAILTPDLYAVVIFIVFLTTLITPPWLKAVFERWSRPPRHRGEERGGTEG